MNSVSLGQQAEQRASHSKEMVAMVYTSGSSEVSGLVNTQVENQYGGMQGILLVLVLSLMAVVTISRRGVS